MKLFFLRHGKAEDHSHDGSDYNRRLTPAGVEEMERVAAGLAVLELNIDLIISSPLPRASETAAIAARALGLSTEQRVVSDRVAAGAFGLGALQSLLHERSAGEAVMLVGHEPDFSSVVRRLTGAAIDMKKSGLAFVETMDVEPDAGILRWLLTPRHLSLIAGARA